MAVEDGMESGPWRLRYRIEWEESFGAKVPVFVFPYQEDIENLMLELGISRDGLGEKPIPLGPCAYLIYSDAHGGWTIGADMATASMAAAKLIMDQLQKK